IHSKRKKTSKLLIYSPCTYLYIVKYKQHRRRLDSRVVDISLPALPIDCSIQGIQGCLNELKLLQVLLKKAIALEKVTLFSYKRHSPDTDAQLMEFKEMLLAFPSASSVSISFQ
ncbi:hypothetical protein MKX01_004575, partial [Papaver californicum]